MENIITIGLAEDHILVRKGFVALLNHYKNFKVLFDVNNGQELLDTLPTIQPDIILLDIDMPVMGGKEALGRISVEYPHIKVIILSVHFEDNYIIDFIREGARAFLPKDSDPAKLLEALNDVYTVGHYYDDLVSEAMAKALTNNSVKKSEILLPKLTKREIEILELLRTNKSNIEISEILNIGLRTVEGHRQHLMQKTNSKNLAALISFVIEHNLLASTDINNF